MKRLRERWAGIKTIVFSVKILELEFEDIKHYITTCNTRFDPRYILMSSSVTKVEVWISYLIEIQK